MKTIERSIPYFQENEFFTPLRSKIDYAKLIVCSARSILIDYEINEIKQAGRMKILVDKMSRIFFYKESKYFSVSFPFILSLRNGITYIDTYTGKNVDNESISIILSILNNEKFRLNPSLVSYFFDSDLSDESVSKTSNSIKILEEIFQSEPSYIRYDFDSENENGRLHPIHHLDVNYSSYGAFKVGLNKSIIEESFESILDISTDCYYFE